MIKFSCKNCARLISVPEVHLGKKGKCPKCGKVVVVPDKSTVFTFQCGNCGRKISVSKVYTGKKGKCPKCSNIIVIPKIVDGKPVTGRSQSVTLPINPAASVLDPSLFKVSEESRSAAQPAAYNGSSGSVQLLLRRQGEDEDEAAGQRKLPWIIDIFLYPASIPGLTVLGVIILIPLLINILARLLGPFGFFVSIPGFFVKIVIGLYMCWYFVECIRDSANGGLRAPETIGSMASLGEMFWQFLRLVACYAFFFGPVTFYSAYNNFYDAETSSAVFWSLQTYGVFFFPMGILAVVMFDSVRGLNPVLIIQSIISTFLLYCGLVILFYGLAVLFILGIVGLILAGIIGGWGLSLVLTFVFISIGFVWLLFVVGHLLGRFYWKYQEKLNWEV